MNRKVDVKMEPGQREPVGELGIGKFAGLGIARRMTLSTRKDGHMTTLVIDRDALDPRDLIRSELDMTIANDPETGHGTTIELTRLSDEIVPMTQDQLIEDLSYEFSQIPDFSIYVNDVLVRYGFKGQIWERIPLNGEVPGYGPYAGEIIIARRPREVKFPGLVVLGRGRRLDGPTTFGWGIRSHGGKMYAYITGWVEADWLTPGTDQARAGSRTPVITGRATLLKERPAVKKFYEIMRADLEKAQERVAELLRKETTELIEADKQLMSAFGNPTIPVDATTRRFMVQVAKSLEEYRPSSRVKIVRKLKEQVEVGENALAIQTIREANPEDAESMARLLKDLSVKEMTALAWEARKRYEAIIQLRRLTKPRLKTLEAILQKFLEDHPWFLQEGYDRYAPNRRLKERIEGEVHVKPDHLFVRDLGDHVVIVELKKMGKPLLPAHAEQALEYRRIARRQYQDARVEVWLVGEKVSQPLREDIKAEERPNVIVKTYDQILRETERRYEYILRHLPEDAAWVRNYQPVAEGAPVREEGLDE